MDIDDIEGMITFTYYHDLAAAERFYGEVMGLEVVGRPWYGLQFHPESILTPGGVAIARVFLEIVSGKFGWK